MNKLRDIMLGALMIFIALFGGSYAWNVLAFPLGEQTPFAWWVMPVGLTIIILGVAFAVGGFLVICFAVDNDMFKPQPNKEEPPCKP